MAPNTPLCNRPPAKTRSKNESTLSNRTAVPALRLALAELFLRRQRLGSPAVQIGGELRSSGSVESPAQGTSCDGLRDHEDR